MSPTRRTHVRCSIRDDGSCSLPSMLEVYGLNHRISQTAKSKIIPMFLPKRLTLIVWKSKTQNSGACPTDSELVGREAPKILRKTGWCRGIEQADDSSFTSLPGDLSLINILIGGTGVVEYPSRPKCSSVP